MKKEPVEIDGVRWEALAVVADYIRTLKFALDCETAKFQGRTELAQRYGDALQASPRRPMIACPG